MRIPLPTNAGYIRQNFDCIAKVLRPSNGVVTLHDMLLFAAEDFWVASGLMAELRRYSEEDFKTADGPLIGKIIGLFKVHCMNLGLSVAVSQIDKFQAELAGEHITSVRFVFWLECISTTVHGELSAHQFFSLESDKNIYLNPSWLMDTVLPSKFPASFVELQSAGRCYSLGESTASSFHSMRALEVCLRLVAAQFSTINTAGNLNWGTLIEQIQAAIKQIGVHSTPGVKKTPEESKDEHFFSEAAIHFLFLKNGWRNHVMHSQANYSDKEALQMLTHVRDLMLHLSVRIAE